MMWLLSFKYIISQFLIQHAINPLVLNYISIQGQVSIIGKLLKSEIIIINQFSTASENLPYG